MDVHRAMKVCEERHFTVEGSERSKISFDTVTVPFLKMVSSPIVVLSSTPVHCLNTVLQMSEILSCFLFPVHALHVTIFQIQFALLSFRGAFLVLQMLA